MNDSTQPHATPPVVGFGGSDLFVGVGKAKLELFTDYHTASHFVDMPAPCEVSEHKRGFYKGFSIILQERFGITFQVLRRGNTICILSWMPNVEISHDRNVG